jgi:hypothetical protein
MYPPEINKQQILLDKIKGGMMFNMILASYVSQILLGQSTR